MSMTVLAPTFSCAYHSASHIVSRPSASVLPISTVLPLALTSTSPGRYAVPLTMFSQDADMKCTSTLGCSSATARAAPNVAAAPPMSNFICSMRLPGPALRL